MKITKSALAGTMESSDIQITVMPAEEEGLTIHLTSIVEVPFGDQIRTVIRETLEASGITSAAVKAVDRGALDCTIRARVTAAVHRATEDDGTFFKGVGL